MYVKLHLKPAYCPPTHPPNFAYSSRRGRRSQSFPFGVIHLCGFVKARRKFSRQCSALPSDLILALKLFNIPQKKKAKQGKGLRSTEMRLQRNK